MAEQHSPATTDLLWTALLTGDPAVAGDETSSHGAVRHIADLYSTPPPGAARERARQRVFDYDSIATENTMSASAIPVPIPSTPGSSTPRSVAGQPISTRWRWISIAAAMLILLAGLGGWLAYERFGPGNSHPAVIPAVQTPTGDDWPMYRGDPARSGVAPEPGPTSSPSPVWTYAAGASAFRSPAIDNGMVYLGNADGVLVALDEATGQERWRFTGDSSLEITPTVIGETLYIPSQNGTLYAIDAATGTERWTFAKPLGEFAVPTFAGGVLFAGSQDDGHLYAIDAATGAEVWNFDTGGPVFRSSAYADGLVYCPNDNGELFAVDAKTGEKVWSVTSENGFGTPAVNNGVVYAGISAYDAKTGEHKFDFANPSGEGQTPVTVAHGLIFSGGWDAKLLAFDANTGELAWSVPTVELVRANPIVGGNVVYLADESGQLMGVDAMSGDVRFTYQLDGVVNFGPSLAGGILYVSTDAGTLYALGEDDGSATPVAEAATAVSRAGFDPSQVQVLWSSTGSETSPLLDPQAVAIAPDGNVYVINGSQNAIDIFAPDGTHLDTWGSEGDAPGQFQFTQGNWVNGSVGFDADGNIYVFDTYNDRIQKFAADRTFIEEWGGDGSENGQTPDVLGAVDAEQGLIYAVDSNDRVQVFDLDGTFLDKWGNTGSGDGQFRVPMDVAVDSLDHVYVGEDAPGRVQKFDSTGRFLDTSGSEGTLQGQIGIVIALTTDSHDNLFVADYSHNNIQILNPQGELIGTISELPDGSAIKTPCGIAVDADGNVYVASEGNNTLYKLKLPPLE